MSETETRLIDTAVSPLSARATAAHSDSGAKDGIARMNRLGYESAIPHD